jgi:hypothetical protein
MKDDRKHSQMLIVNRGRVVDAVYREPEIDAYAGNPLQEALPPYLTTQQLILRLKYRPDYQESQRSESDENRVQLLQYGLRFFTPLDVHIDLYRRFSNLIRTGYFNRNPLTETLERKPKPRIRTFDQYEEQYQAYQDEPPSTAAGFNMAGTSGIGKSFSILRILNLFPQVIRHSLYRGHPFTQHQLVWLKIDCPFDGYPRALCISFFKVVDAILGTTYKDSYVKRGRLEAELLNDMSTVADNHFLGVLVIDEIQRLSLAKSGGTRKLLNFFVQLLNEIGVPVVLVGTYKALDVFGTAFSYLRRGTGQGDLIWDRMENDAQWQVFVKSLFKLQYTRQGFSHKDLEQLSDIDKNLGRVPKDLGDVLYEETQGITDLAVKVYRFAQERAIDSKKEVVTADLIRSVAADKLKMLSEVLTALKSGDKRALARFDDLYPTCFKDYLTALPDQEQQVLEVTGKIKSSPEIKAQLEAAKAQALSLPSNESKKPDGEGEQSTEESAPATGAAKPRSNVRSAAKGNKRVPRRERGVLPGLVADLDKNDRLAGYNALKEAGFVRPASDYIVE